MLIAVIGVDYDEGNLDSYKGCYVSQHGNVIFSCYKGVIKGEEKHILSIKREWVMCPKDDAFYRDLMACNVHCILEKIQIYWSSSVDTFQMERHEDYVSKLHASSHA